MLAIGPIASIYPDAIMVQGSTPRSATDLTNLGEVADVSIKPVAGTGSISDWSDDFSC